MPHLAIRCGRRFTAGVINARTARLKAATGKNRVGMRFAF